MNSSLTKKQKQYELAKYPLINTALQIRQQQREAQKLFHPKFDEEWFQNTKNQISKKDLAYLKSIIIVINRAVYYYTNPKTYQKAKSVYGSLIYDLLQEINQKILRYISNSKIEQLVFPEWQNLKKRYEKISKIQLLTVPVQKTSKDIEVDNYFSKLIKYMDSNQQSTQYAQLSESIAITAPKNHWKFVSCVIRSYKNQNVDEFINNLHNQNHMPKNYLCCAQFFYQDFDIYDPTIDDHYQVQIIKYSQKINQNQIRQCVVSFLNAKGGIILFDCSQQFTNVLAKGYQLSENNKQQLQQRIASYLTNISPPVSFKKGYEISFVPVVENPLKKKKNQDVKLQYIEGRYIMRILVFPPQPQITYHYNINQVSYFYIRQNGKNIAIEGDKIHNFMVQRFINNKNKSYKHEHPQKLITNPHRGNPLYEENMKAIDSRKEANDTFQYKFASLLVCDKQSINKVSELLTKYKIDHAIIESFPGYNFRLAATTFILQHNTKFDKIKVYLSQESIKYANGTKQVMIISTAKSLQTVLLEKSGIHNLQKWLKGCFPQQNLNTQQINNDLYLKMDTFLGSIFMYMLLDNFGIKARFKKLAVESGDKIKPFEKV